MLMWGEWEGDWRLRVGEYRVIYEIDDRAHRVIIIRVRHRSEAYSSPCSSVLSLSGLVAPSRPSRQQLDASFDQRVMALLMRNGTHLPHAGLMQSVSDIKAHLPIRLTQHGPICCGRP